MKIVNDYKRNRDFVACRRKMRTMFISRIVFSAILFIGAALHAYGSFLAFPEKGPALVWSLGSSGFAILLAGLCLVAAWRPSDIPLAALSILGCAGWVAVVIAYGVSIGNPADPRVLYHAVTGVVLAGLTLTALMLA